MPLLPHPRDQALEAVTRHGRAPAYVPLTARGIAPIPALTAE